MVLEDVEAVVMIRQFIVIFLISLVMPHINHCDSVGWKVAFYGKDAFPVIRMQTYKSLLIEMERVVICGRMPIAGELGTDT